MILLNLIQGYSEKACFNIMPNTRSVVDPGLSNNFVSYQRRSKKTIPNSFSKSLNFAYPKEKKTRVDYYRMIS